MQVSDILRAKGTSVESISPRTSLADLARRLKAARVGAMIVSEDGQTIDGIVSERDVIAALAENGPAAATMQVREICTSTVHTCKPDEPIADVARLMTLRRIRHVPVVDRDGDLVGIVSIGDVLKNRLDEMQLEANVLRDVAIAART